MNDKQEISIKDVRSWKGTLKDWETHKECILHWCGGGDVEVNVFGNDGFKWEEVPDCVSPAFHHSNHYRVPKGRKPKAGEVWMMKGTPLLVTETGFVDFKGGVYEDTPNGLLFAAEHIAGYVATEFYKLAEVRDSGFLYEDSVKLLNIIKGCYEETIDSVNK